MLVGVPKEIKNHEYRIGLTPAGVRELVGRGHRVMVQREAGKAVGLTDEMYEKVGAEIVGSAEEIFERADMIIKVKEPQAAECAMLRPDQVLFTYLHLAADLQQTAALCRSGCVAIAYETITDGAGRLPLLAPMSEVAGRMAVQAGARCLEQAIGGSGILQHMFFLVWGMVFGALIGALLAGEFKIRLPRQRARYVQSAGGGLAMGYGAGIAMGCTIGAFFSAIPSLALNGWVFALFLAVGAWLGVQIIQRIP
jgi:alanine dehydrogenase